MTVTAANDTVTYKSPRGDTERPADLVVAVNADGSSIGGGTQYTEDAPAAANPVGNALMLVRRDTLTSAEVSADGDNVAGKANANGELYVTDSGGLGALNSILAKIIAAPGTEAKQDAANALLTSLLAEAVSTTPVSVSGLSYNASASFTPAATSHVAGDCNGAAQEFTSMGSSAGRIMITSAWLRIDGATAEATAWRLYLFGVTPPSAIADDGAFTFPSGDRASCVGYIDIGTAVDLVDTQWIETHSIQKQVKLTGTSLFGYLVNLTTLTPANVAHTVMLHAVGL